MHVLRCACSPGSTVLHAGCGISSLSQALYDDGFRHQLAVDFSEQCMLRQRELSGPSRPEMGNAVMDCTRLGLRPASVDVCIDKGTLDALLCIDERSEEAISALLNLGYSRNQIEGTVAAAAEALGEAAGLEDLIRDSLRRLSK